MKQQKTNKQTASEVAMNEPNILSFACLNLTNRLVSMDVTSFKG